MRKKARFAVTNGGDYRLWQDFLDEESRKYGWVFVEYEIYRKNGMMLKVHKTVSSQFMVTSFLEHPKWGEKTLPLIRTNISRAELIEILKNPRTHTDKGFIPNSPKRRLDSLYNQIQQKR